MICFIKSCFGRASLGTTLDVFELFHWFWQWTMLSHPTSSDIGSSIRLGLGGGRRRIWPLCWRRLPPAAPAAPVRTLPSQCISLLAQAWIFHKGNWTLWIPALLGGPLPCWEVGRPRSWEMSSRNWRSAIRNNIASCFASQGSKSGSQLQVDGISTLAYYQYIDILSPFAARDANAPQRISLHR